MPSVHRVRRSQFWYAAFYLPNGRRTLRSTGTSDKRLAMEVCLKWDRAAKLGREGRFTEIRAREAISDIFAIANKNPLPNQDASEFFSGWLETKQIEISDSSLPGYQRAVDYFLEYISEKKKKTMDSITLDDSIHFRDHLSRRLSQATVNKYVKILRSAFREAIAGKICTVNAFEGVRHLKVRNVARRAFTFPELRQIIKTCDEDWRGAVIAGLYTGQRLSDITNLTWRQVDFDTGEIRFQTRKTDSFLKIPMAEPLKKYFIEKTSADDPDLPVFPTLAGKESYTLSGQFARILSNAGLISPPSHRGKGKGRDMKRTGGKLSFHCLRHTATSLLKNAGVSDVVARELIGHESSAVSRVYTHIEGHALRKAIDQLPDVLK